MVAKTAELVCPIHDCEQAAEFRYLAQRDHRCPYPPETCKPQETQVHRRENQSAISGHRLGAPHQDASVLADASLAAEAIRSAASTALAALSAAAELPSPIPSPRRASCTPVSAFTPAWSLQDTATRPPPPPHITAGTREDTALPARPGPARAGSTIDGAKGVDGADSDPDSDGDSLASEYRDALFLSRLRPGQPDIRPGARTAAIADGDDPLLLRLRTARPAVVQSADGLSPARHCFRDRELLKRIAAGPAAAGGGGDNAGTGGREGAVRLMDALRADVVAGTWSCCRSEARDSMGCVTGAHSHLPKCDRCGLEYDPPPPGQRHLEPFMPRPGPARPISAGYRALSPARDPPDRSPLLRPGPGNGRPQSAAAGGGAGPEGPAGRLFVRDAVTRSVLKQCNFHPGALVKNRFGTALWACCGQPAYAAVGASKPGPVEIAASSSLRSHLSSSSLRAAAPAWGCQFALTHVTAAARAIRAKPAAAEGGGTQLERRMRELFDRFCGGGGGGGGGGAEGGISPAGDSAKGGGREGRRGEEEDGGRLDAAEFGAVLHYLEALPRFLLAPDAAQIYHAACALPPPRPPDAPADGPAPPASPAAAAMGRAEFRAALELAADRLCISISELVAPPPRAPAPPGARLFAVSPPPALPGGGSAHAARGPNGVCPACVRAGRAKPAEFDCRDLMSAYRRGLSEVRCPACGAAVPLVELLDAVGALRHCARCSSIFLQPPPHLAAALDARTAEALRRPTFQVVAHRSTPLRLVVDASRPAEFAPAPGRLRLHGRDDGGRGAELGVFEYKRVAEVRAAADGDGDDGGGVKLEFLAADGSAWPGDFRHGPPDRPQPAQPVVVVGDGQAGGAKRAGIGNIACGRRLARSGGTAGRGRAGSRTEDVRILDTEAAARADGQWPARLRT